MRRLVSILIPAFNAEKWIQSCIQSALAQTWPTKEIIVVDDGSTDDTLRIARGFCSRDVRVVTQTNRGASAARNQALSLSQGDYIQWLDADDLLAPDKIALQMMGAEPGCSTRILQACAWGQFYNYPMRSRFMPSLLWGDLDPVEWLFRKMDGNLWMAIESWLVSRKLTQMAGPWDEKLSLDDDGEYFCRVVSCSTKIRFSPNAKVYVRKGTFGISHSLTLNSQKLNSQAISLGSHIRTLRNMEESPRTKAACLKLLQRWSSYFYPEMPDVFNRMQSMAEELGGLLNVPQLPRKYQWLQLLFGWSAAKKAQRILPSIRSAVEMKLELIESISSEKERSDKRRDAKETAV